MDTIKPPEQPKGLSFEELLTEWHNLKEGDGKEFIVADSHDKPLRKNNKETGEKEHVLLVIKAEPKHVFDETLEVQHEGTNYAAYEYVTNFDDVRMLESYFDDQYFDKAAQKDQKYIPLKEFIAGNAPKEPKQKVAPAPRPQPESQAPAQFPTLKDAAETVDETAETVKAYSERIEFVLKGDVPDSNPDAEYLRSLHNDFMRQEFRYLRDTGLGQTLNDDVEITQELKISPGLVLMHAGEPFRGKQISEHAKNLTPVPTLIIRFLQQTQPMANKQYVAEFTGEQLLRAAAITKCIQTLNSDDALHTLPYVLILQGLRKRGYRQVRLEVLSYRSRGSKEAKEVVPYRIYAKLYGNALPETNE